MTGNIFFITPVPSSSLATCKFIDLTTQVVAFNIIFQALKLRLQVSIDHSLLRDDMRSHTQDKTPRLGKHVADFPEPALVAPALVPIKKQLLFFGQFEFSTIPF